MLSEKSSFPRLQINTDFLKDNNLDMDSFSQASIEEQESFYASQTSELYRQSFVARFKGNKVAMLALVCIIILLLFAFIGPIIYPYSYSEQVMTEENLPPFWLASKEYTSDLNFNKWQHPLGTDILGRDSVARLMKGTQISIIIGISGSFIVLVIGGIYGSIAGYFGNKIDFIMMRIADIIYSIPDVLVALLLASILKPSLAQFVNINPSSSFSKFVNTIGAPLIAIFITFGLLYWVGMSRLVRGQVLMLKSREFVLAAKVLGVSPMRILKKHILPNCIGQIIVATCLQIPTAIFLESFLSFLGVGVSAPLTSLGSMASDALSEIYSRPYNLLYPTILLSMLVLSLNLLGDGLLDTLDPHAKK